MAAVAQALARVDVAIVGGGPCGLATAHALAKVLPATKSIALYERVPALNIPRGAGLGLEVNGLKALQAICPAVLDDIMERHAVVMDSAETRDPQGVAIKSMDCAPMHAANRERWGVTSVQLGWHELVATLAEHLPPRVEVHQNTKLLGYEHESDDADGRVTLQLQGPGGEADTTTVSAGLLVGCDGFFSRVRQQCLADGPPDFGGAMVWRARVEAAQAEKLGYPPRQTVWYMGGNRVLLVYTVGPGHIVWTASCPEAGLIEAGIDWRAVAESRRDASAQSSDYLQRTREGGEVAKERLLRAFSGLDPQVQRLMAETAPEVIVEHAIYVRAAAAMTPEWWGKGNVVLLGDAAHPMRPTGQGTNQAFEDALLLGRALAKDGEDVAKQLEGFRNHRAQRLQPLMAQVEAMGKASYKQDAKAATAASQANMTSAPQQQREAAAAEGSPAALLEKDYQAYVFGGEDWAPLVASAMALATANV